MDSKGKIKKIPEIWGKKITLRRLRFSDAKSIYQNIKDKTIIRWTLSIPHPYTEDNAVRFIRKVHYGIRKKRGYIFGIVSKQEQGVIGVIELCKINYNDRNAEIGYWLGKRYWGEGLMTEAVNLVLNFGFRKLKLHKIHAALFEENITSKRVLEKAGFRLEGKIRESRFRYKKWHNELRYGILYSEFKSK